MKIRAAAVLLAALSGASCTAPLMKLPAGPGAPISAADAAALLADACRGVRALTAEIGVGGSAGGRRMRGRLLAGVAAPDSARLEAVAPFGQPIFIFTAVGDKATLLLPRDGRVLKEAPPGEVLDAVAGVPLDAADLFTILSGCVPAGSVVESVALGDLWRKVVVRSGRSLYDAYLHRGSATQPWRLVAIVRDSESDVSLNVEYRDNRDNRPRSIRLSGGGSQSEGSVPFDITLTLSQVETNMTLDSQAFTIQIPADADPITLEELRRSGPLAPESHG